MGRPKGSPPQGGCTRMQSALNFDGHTGPYIQNAHVRANSIINKAGGFPSQANFDYPLTSHEIQLVDQISRFPNTVQQAAQEYRPLIIANYAYELASTFHSFYPCCPVSSRRKTPLYVLPDYVWWQLPGRRLPMPCACWISKHHK